VTGWSFHSRRLRRWLTGGDADRCTGTAAAAPTVVAVPALTPAMPLDGRPAATASSARLRNARRGKRATTVVNAPVVMTPAADTVMN